jgi:RNA 2',3'-cyclic 3'-phosphodiesterase
MQRPEMSRRIRAFIALKLPGKVIASIKTVQEDVKRYRFPVRWVRPENIHLTIKFFGDITESDVAAIDAVMKSCAGGYAPFSLSAKGAGIFPGISRPRIIWAGISGDTARLLDLRNSLEKRFDETGFKKEERPFKGHLTIGRFSGKIESGKLFEALKKVQDFESEIFVAGKIYLYGSDLKPEGPVYTELLEVPLTGVKII